MKSFLAKRWFLILLVTSIALALWQTDLIRPVVAWIPTRAVVAGALFLISWSLESRRLWQAVTRPLPALWAVAISYGFVPPLGWLIGSWFPEDYRIGILVVASVPCSLASAALWTRRFGGNEATALLVTMLTTCTSWLITTGWLTLMTGTGVRLDALGMMGDLVLYLVVPVSVGQLARWPLRLRQVAIQGKTVLGVLSQLLIFIIIVQGVVLAADRLGHNQLGEQVLPLLAVVLACSALHLSGLLAGYWGGKLWRIDRPNLIAVAFAGSQKTLPVGLFLVDVYFRSYPLAVVPVLFYHVGQLVLDTIVGDLAFGAKQAGEG